MKISEINPFIRFASKTYFGDTVTFNVFDCRIFCVLNGEMEIVTKSKHHILKSGSVFYCSSGSTYTFVRNDGCELLTLNFDLSQNRNNMVNCCQPFNVTKENKPRFEREVYIEDCDFLNNDISFNNAPYFISGVRKIIKEFSEKKIFYCENASACLKGMLIEMHRHSLDGAATSSDTIDRMIDYIRVNLSGKITNSELASIAGYHEYHLNRLFLRYTGMTIHRYVLECRLSEVKNMLIGTDMTLSEIAEATGFNSNTHLSSAFRNAEHCTPSEYRLKMKNKI